MDKFVISADDAETRFSDFSLDFGGKCMVFPRRAHPIHDDETPSRTKGMGQVSQYFFGSRQFMVGVYDENRVCRAGTKMRVIDTADHCLNVVFTT